jgi:ABC-type sulfate transport system permease subunit
VTGTDPADASRTLRTVRLLQTLAVLCAVGSLCAIASLVVVFDMRIGPVVLVISQRYGRGVHLGDLLIGVPFGLVAVGAGLVAVLAYQRAHRLTAR